jgi:hypothetical protein
MTKLSNNEMMDKISWLGKVLGVHSIGEYHLVEFKPKVYEDCTPKVPTEYATESLFTGFIGTNQINISYSSLDEALVSLIAIKHCGSNTVAGEYFMKMIK